jgi:hypothetical protein
VTRRVKPEYPAGETTPPGDIGGETMINARDRGNRRANTQTAEHPAEKDLRPSRRNPMTLPTLTPEQRQAALVKATEVRQARAALLAQLKTGDVTLADLLRRDDETVKRIKVSQALRALSGIGPTKAAALMQRAGVDDRRRIGGLGVQQRRKLVEALS